MANQEVQVATLGGGCFWCVETIFRSVRGVESSISGYSGGTKETADYKTVCSGSTDHAEVIQVTFDPSVIDYEQILKIFFTVHDPTTPNRQGNDVGPQYRSVIFYHDEAQREIAERMKAEYATQVWDDPIVTKIDPFDTFYEAEAYHQDYYNKVGDRNSYCTFVITPKVSKFRKHFSHLMKSATV